MLSYKFLERVRSEHVVDTRNYRYVFISDTGVIIRKPLRELGTTSDWETVVAMLVNGGWRKE